MLFTDYNLTVDPVAMIKVVYLKVSPAALVRVFEARSAVTISVLRIKSIPVQASQDEKQRLESFYIHFGV